MLGARIEELLAQEQQQQSQSSGSGAMISNTTSTYVSSNIAIITDEVKQKQLLQEDEAEDFLDEG